MRPDSGAEWTLDDVLREGVDTCERTVRTPIPCVLEPFQTVTEYGDSLVQQNASHLREQRNSTDDVHDARRKYILRQRIQSLAPHFVSKDYDSGPFKLICDDFGPGNILVKEDTPPVSALYL
jgi:hypothetical protein